MKNIAVLIDFSDGSRSALDQAVSLARKNAASVHAVHIVSTPEKVSSASSELNQFTQPDEHNGVTITNHVVVGELAHATNSMMAKTNSELVIICTHGIRGMFQQLFGAQILKLVQAIKYPCIVIGAQFKGDLSAVSQILFPLGPHPEFNIKIRQTAEIAKSLGASLTLYQIERGGADSELLEHNLVASSEYFTSHGIPYFKVVEDVKMFSVGYSRQTMEYAQNNGITLMSLMATVSKNDTLFGYGDKENFLVNTMGIAILTCND